MVLVSVLRLSNIMAAVEKVEKECEEETLQTAFKKLRVDAERFVAFSFVSEPLVVQCNFSQYCANECKNV